MNYLVLILNCEVMVASWFGYIMYIQSYVCFAFITSTCM